jgi:hypothetical protein
VSGKLKNRAAPVPVRQVTTAREHTCNWPGCVELVAPAFWGCKDHWYTLPAALRSRLWQTWNPAELPSDEYVAAARAVQQWISEYEYARAHA